MVDAGGFFAGVSGAALMQALVMLLARRWLGRVDAIETEVKDLREKEMARVENNISTAARSRKEIHERLTRIERDMVGRKDLEKIQVDYVGQVRQLAQVATKIEHLSAHIDEQTQRMASVTADVHRLLGRLEDKKA